MNLLPSRRRIVMALAGLAALPACTVTPGDEAADIEVQPQPVSARSGSAATFSVTATGDDLSFQWQRSVDQGASWVDITGAVAARYVIAVVDPSMNGYRFRVRVRGGGTEVTSTPVLLTVEATSTLLPRLGGTVFYEPSLNLSVLANANLAASLPLGVAGIGSDGTMTWAAANAWVAALNAAHHLGHGDWRLPTTGPIDGVAFRFVGDPSNPYNGYDGTQDLGYNIGAPGTAFAGRTTNEMAFLFYHALASLPDRTTTGAPQVNTSNTNAPLLGVAKAPYWTSVPYGSDGALAFNFGTGTQYAYQASTNVNPNAGFRFNVMVVRDGDS